MRFSAAIHFPPNVPGAQVVRQPEPVAPAQPMAPVALPMDCADALPPDLDQRVRQSGEW